MAEIQLTVKVADYNGSNIFTINDYRKKTVKVASGDTIILNQSDSSNAGHPLRIALYPDGEHNIGPSDPQLDYVAYVNFSGDLLNYYNAGNLWNYGDGNITANSRPKAEFGESHWVGSGQNEGRVPPPVMGRYEVGVSITGTPGSSGAQTTFTVTDASLHGTYFYYCENHTGMGGMIHYGNDPEKYRLIDQGATAHDEQDGDVTSSIIKKIEYYDENTSGWVFFDIIDTPHVNPWAALSTNISESIKYRITYSVTDSALADSFQKVKTFNIITEPGYQRPTWMSQDIPIDEEGRIWAIQCIVGLRGASATNLGHPWSHDLPYYDFGQSVTFYVVLRNDSVEGAGAGYAPYSVANPLSGWDAGIPQTHQFASPYYIYTGLKDYAGLIGMIIPSGWEFRVYRSANYVSQKYHYSASTRFIDKQWNHTVVNVDTSNYQISNNINVFNEGHNNRGVMTAWGHQNSDFYKGLGGSSYLFKKIAMPAGY
jgi:hypothetical protein